MDNTQTQTQVQALRTLQQSYDTLASASSAQATSTALEAAKQAILTAIGALNNPSVADIQDGLAKEDTLGDVAEALEYMQQGGMPQIEQIAKQGSNSAVTLTSIDEKLDTYGGSSIPMVTVTNDVLSQELLPNTCYMFVNRTNDLTITLGTPLDSGVSEYHMFLYIGDTVPTVTFPQDVDFGGTFIISSDKTNSCIEISILNNMGICVIW